jgi:hypothetical protein
MVHSDESDFKQPSDEDGQGEVMSKERHVVIEKEKMDDKDKADKASMHDVHYTLYLSSIRFNLIQCILM